MAKTHRMKILSVDDEPVNQMVIEELIEDKYDIKLVYSGEECLETVAKYNPDLILLDISMPGINGYETCEILKQDEKTRKIPVIILSALSSTEERLRGYEVGAEDYIPKPFNHDELLEKIDRYLDTYTELPSELREAEERLEKIEKDVHQSRFDTIKTVNFITDLGTIIRFFEDAKLLETPEQLSLRTIEAMEDLRLKGTIQLRINSAIINMSTCGEVTPMEESVIESLRNKGSFFDFKNQTAINNSNSTIIIKNMPDNHAKHDKVKDVLSVFSGCLESLCTHLLGNTTYNENSEQVLGFIKETLSNIENISTTKSDNILQQVGLMAGTLNVHINNMQMHETHQKQLVKMVDNLVSDYEDVIANNLDIEETTKSTCVTLNRMFSAFVNSQV